MDDKTLKQRLDNLGQKITEIKADRDFETRYHDGHKRSLAEMEKHYKKWHQKTESDLRDYEEKHGHINEMERDLIILMDSVEL